MRQGGGVPRNKGRSSAVGGSVLIEAMVGFLVLAIALVPLTQSVLSLAHRSGRLETRFAALSPSPTVPGGPGTGWSTSPEAVWSWGPRAGIVSWGEGPELILELVGPGTGVTRSVGVWVDGWPAEECGTSPGQRVSCGSALLWRSRPGAEVILRGRSDDGAWGPPLRTLVPASATLPSPPSVFASEAVVHMPAAGGHSLDFQGVPLVNSGLTWVEPAVLESVPLGPASLGTPVSSQSWLAEENRGVDLFF